MIEGDVQAISQGMVALCMDGNYSDNHDLSATCSGGGGINRWLGGFGECNDGRVIPMSTEASCRDNGGFRTVLPAGFTPTARPTDVALCNDGTYSDNTDFAGTCSSAQGVDRWLAEFGECTDGSIIEMSGSATCGDFGFKALRPDYTPPTTTIYVPTREEEIEIARLAFEIVFNEMRVELARIVDAVDGVAVDRLEYEPDPGRVTISVTTTLDATQVNWDLAKVLAQLWNDTDGAWYVPAWSPSLLVITNGQARECSGPMMVDIGSFRAGRPEWDAAC